jgi:Ca2+-binding RTX toxin-like protein
MKRISVLLLLVVTAALPVAAQAGAFPLQVTCFGEAADAAYDGTSGPDTFYGTPGDDVMIGWAGDDILYGNGGRDRICGGAGDDVIYGGSGGDLLDGDWDNDRVYGQTGNDGYVLGGDGNDILFPGSGAIGYTATVEGGAGRDRIVIDRPGYNEVFGGEGRDTIDFRRAPFGMLVDLRFEAEYIDDSGVPTIGGKAFEVENVYGSSHDDFLSGNAQGNHLYGFAGSDTLHGRAGGDFLDGGTSVGDWLEGDEGVDTCVDPDGFIVGDECEIWP